MANAPQWAQDLVLTVLQDENCDRVPDLTWHRSKRNYDSSGVCYKDRIHVTAGTREGLRYRQTWQSPIKKVTARQVQKATLLHELAHWLTPKEHHSAKFWDKAWELFRRYSPAPIGYLKVSEGNYRKGAIAAYKRRNVRGETR